MKKLTIEDIKKRIDEYVTNGGSIYDGRRQLPFYDNLQKLTKRIQSTTNPEFTIEDAYKLCGYDFDREYGDYTRLISTLSSYADKDGYVDSLKKIKGADAPKTLLKKMATALGCSPSDYLILMTDYRYEKAIITTDYIDQLRKELKATYPDGDITNIKRENPTLYEKLRHVCKYSPEVGINDMQSVAEYFGLTNDRFSNTNIYQHLEQKKILAELHTLFPDGNIDVLAKNNPTLYHKIAKCAASEDKTIKQWLGDNGFNYTPSQKTNRFSKTVVNSKTREQELFSTIKSLVGNLKTDFKDGKDEYYYKKNIAKLILSHLEQPHIK